MALPLLIPIGIAATAALGWFFLRPKKTASITSPPPRSITLKPTASVAAEIASAINQKGGDDLVEVKLGNETWAVSPDYIGPVGIGEAAEIAKAAGMELPSPALVDAIWRQADLKLLPMPRENIVSQKVFDDQKRRIQEQIAGRPFSLVAGQFKDVVMFGGHPQIYGWHVEDGKTVPGIPLLKPFTPGPGKIIQPLSGGRHSLDFKDYSQGARLVKRIS